MKKYPVSFICLLSIIFTFVNVCPIFALPVEQIDNLVSDKIVDDYANQLKDAQSVLIPNEINGAIETTGDIDYFMFKISEPCNITINSVGTTDMYGILMTEDGSKIAEDDDSAGYKNFIISRKLDVGIYYVAVKHYYSDQTGKYTLFFNSATLEDDIGDDISKASEYNLENSVPSAINYSGDVDVFKIDIEKKDNYTFSTKGFTDTYGTLVNSKGIKIVEDDDGGNNKNFSFSTVLSVGIYYLYIKDFYEDRTGSYTMLVSKYGQDDFGNDYSSAENFKLGEEKDGCINYAGDIDVFKFSVDKEGIVILTTEGNTDTLGILTDEKGNEISKDDDTGLLKNFSITKHLTSGIYYLSIQNANPKLIGDYKLKIQLQDVRDDDYGNDKNSSSNIELNTNLSGSLSYEGDIDYFSFSLDKKTDVVINTTGISDTFGTLFDSDGNQLLYDDDGDSKNFLINTTLNKGKYYIEVKNYYSVQLGFYTLFLTDKNSSISEITPAPTNTPTNTATPTIAQSEPGTVTVKLVDSKGNGISGGVVTYAGSSWQSIGTTDSNGKTSIVLPTSTKNITVRMTYAGVSKDIVQNVQDNPVFTFQTVSTLVKLVDSKGIGISGGVVTYAGFSWQSIGTTDSNGEVRKELLPTGYTFRMTYTGSSKDIAQNVGSNDTVNFSTVSTLVKLVDSKGIGISGGVVKYSGSSWQSIGTTDSNGEVRKELLPTSYTFRMTYTGSSKDIAQNVGSNDTVNFSTVSTLVKLVDSKGVGISGGVVTYSGSSWQSIGTTDSNGEVRKELLPTGYTFRMTYAGSSKDIAQNVGSNDTVNFSTVSTLVKLVDSKGVGVSGGVVKYSGSSWQSIGTTDSNGEVRKELLPTSYTFRMTYAGSSKDIAQNVGSNDTVNFSTVSTLVKLVDSKGVGISGGVVKYSGSSWQSIGTTDPNGEVRKELLPTSYTFRMTYGKISKDLLQNIEIDKNVIFTN